MNQFCPLKRLYICRHPLFKQTAESQMLESMTLFHCRAAFILSKILASLLPCLLLSWPWVSQDQTMTLVLCLDCKESCLFPTFSVTADNNNQWEEFRCLKKKGYVGYYCNCCKICLVMKKIAFFSCLFRQNVHTKVSVCECAA